MTKLIVLINVSSCCQVILSGNLSAISAYWSSKRKSIRSQINRNYSSHVQFNFKVIIIDSDYRIVELSQIEPLPPITGKDEHTEIERQESEIIMETYSPISPSADRNLIKPLGFCEQEFRLSVSHENNNVMWDLAEFAKAGKLLKVPAMEVNFFDEYEMRKVYSLVYDVFRCKYF